jgi:hypothetical protein
MLRAMLNGKGRGNGEGSSTLDGRKVIREGIIFVDRCHF